MCTNETLHEWSLTNVCVHLETKLITNSERGWRMIFFHRCNECPLSTVGGFLSNVFCGPEFLFFLYHIVVLSRTETGEAGICPTLYQLFPLNRAHAFFVQYKIVCRDGTHLGCLDSLALVNSASLTMNEGLTAVKKGFILDLQKDKLVFKSITVYQLGFV